MGCLDDEVLGKSHHWDYTPILRGQVKIATDTMQTNLTGNGTVEDQVIPLVTSLPDAHEDLRT